MKNLMSKILWVALIGTLANASAFACGENSDVKVKQLDSTIQQQQQQQPAPQSGSGAGGSSAPAAPQTPGG